MFTSADRSQLKDQRTLYTLSLDGVAPPWDFALGSTKDGEVRRGID